MKGKQPLLQDPFMAVGVKGRKEKMEKRKLRNTNSQRDNFSLKGILQCQIEWAQFFQICHGERSQHVIIGFIEVHSNNLLPFSCPYCPQAGK